MNKKKREIPNYDLPIIETHCHLDYLKEQPLNDILNKAKKIGVEHVITIAVSPDNLDRVMAITQQYEQVWGTQGIHPHNAELYNDKVEQTIRNQLNNKKILAVGEIGLDYFYDHADRTIQRAVFEKQLAIAIEKKRPVIIHTRNADEDMQAILKNFVNNMPNKGVIHSFTSSISLAEYCLTEGFNLGFNGICTFKKTENVHKVMTITPLEQILLETDAPYLTPEPYRGRENAPFYLPFIAEKIAMIKQVTVEEVLQKTYQNSLKTFFRE